MREESGTSDVRPDLRTVAAQASAVAADGATQEQSEDGASVSDVVHDPMKIDYSDQQTITHQAISDKFRFQLPTILILSALLQMAVAFSIYRTVIFTESLKGSLIICFVANLIGLLNFRRLRLFPGSRRFAYLLPAFVIPWIFVGALLLWLRPPYSALHLVVGFSSAVGLAWFFNLLNRNSGNSQPLLLIPSDSVSQMVGELPHLHYRMCWSPQQLAGNTTIIADLRADMPGEWERALTKAVLAGATLYHFKQVLESLTGRVKVDHLSENSAGTVQPSTIYFALKGVAERALAFVGLIVVSPIIAVAALAIALESPGSPLFRQERVGFRGEVFTILKLRTMRTDVAAPDAREAAITQVNDPRITRLGLFLRKTRIDELPQLWNVATGKLSLIGPRPEAVVLAKWYEEQLDFYAYRHMVRPGITGWAQVNQGHVADAASVARKLEYDFYYIKNFSLWLDILIVFKTLQVVFTGHGAR